MVLLVPYTGRPTTAVYQSSTIYLYQPSNVHCTTIPENQLNCVLFCCVVIIFSYKFQFIPGTLEGGSLHFEDKNGVQTKAVVAKDSNPGGRKRKEA